MNQWSRNLLTPVAMAAAFLALVMVYDASGLRQAINPARVATVRLKDLRENLAQEAANREQLKAMDASFLEEIRTREADIETLQKALLELPEEQRTEEAKDILNLKKLNLQAWGRQSQEELIIERALRFENLYKKIAAAAEELAVQQGYDLVLINDASDELLVNPDSDVPKAHQRAAQLMQRRVLYGGQTIDITDDLTMRMNNVFKNGQR